MRLGCVTQRRVGCAVGPNFHSTRALLGPTGALELPLLHLCMCGCAGVVAIGQCVSKLSAASVRRQARFVGAWVELFMIN